MFKFKTFILYLVSLIFFGNQVFANQIFTFNNQVGPIKNGRSGASKTNKINNLYWVILKLNFLS